MFKFHEVLEFTIPIYLLINKYVNTLKDIVENFISQVKTLKFFLSESDLTNISPI